MPNTEEDTLWESSEFTAELTLPICRAETSYFWPEFFGRSQVYFCGYEAYTHSTFAGVNSGGRRISVAFFPSLLAKISNPALRSRKFSPRKVE